MVLTFRWYPLVIEKCLKRKIHHGGKFILHCQRKHLSEIVPFQNKASYLKEKINELVLWYDEFTGMDEVRKAQSKVVEDEEYFRNSQQHRRDVLADLKLVQKNLKDVHAELERTDRGEERYLYLVTKEHQLLKDEKTVMDKFLMAEKIERDSFTALSTSVKVSHEKERAQSERTKYWSIIGSIMGTVIGILGSSINNHFKMNELKQLIKQSSDQQLLENLHNYLESNEKLLVKFKDQVDMQENSGFVKLEDILNSLNNRMNKVENSLVNTEKCTNSLPKIITVSENEYKKVAVPVEDLTETLRKEQNQTKMLLFTLVVLSILMPIVTRFS